MNAYRFLNSRSDVQLPLFENDVVGLRNIRDEGRRYYD